VSETRKTRIAVLGGGPSAMSALYWLTSTPELRARYDITVYQMGWRLGGKGASGRGEDGRILEHGLHVLFGFYQNFFYMIRHVYAELGRPAGHPLRTWRQAFHPSNFGVEEEYVQGAWDPWMIAFPRNAATPGSHGALLSLPQYLVMAVQGLVGLVFGPKAALALTRRLYPTGAAWEQAKDPPIGGDDPWGARLLFQVWLGAMVLATHMVQWTMRHARWVVSLYEDLRGTLWVGVKWLASHSRRGHRVWLDLDALLAIMTGTLADGLLLPGGFARVDREDFRDWLLRHGLHRETLDTTLVRTIYDAAFSYEDGDPDRQRASAGSTVRVLMRWAATYKGAPFYLMQAGMGDVVFTPLYQVLKSRGVRFEFFHKVEALHLTEDRQRIGAITINRQAELAQGVATYDPLKTIRGLECWPAEPCYEQLADPDRIRGIDLESYYSGYVGTRVTLNLGTEFDQVLFGIPIGAVRFLCAELVENPATPRWREMVEHVKSVQTVSSQLWLTKTIHELGWQYPRPLLSLFVEPYNTWADMSQVLDREDWPPGFAPADASYFTGAQIGPRDPPPLDDRDFESRMTQDAYDAMLAFMQGRSRNPRRDAGVGGLTTLLPGGAQRDHPAMFDWSLLVDTGGREGEARLRSQYWRSNCGPSERCTLSLPDTNQHRMKAGETGYANLFITGDWTDNNLYLAFMEASFQAGILSARAVAGEDFPIIGEWLNHL
jgi:uncharacterized protein with NAD-binding domain and iron-sulfur cluster